MGEDEPAPQSRGGKKRKMRKFGVELEMLAGSASMATGNHFQHARDVLRDVNIDAITAPYSGREYTRWQVKPDGSLPRNGLEVVARIMPAAESSYDEIRRAVDALSAAGYGVSGTQCGMHVHVNVSDLPKHVRQLVALRYAEIQDRINAFLPRSRRNNGYCPPMSSSQRTRLAAAVDSGATSDFVGLGHNSATNFDHCHGSNARIEFRQAAGTVSAAKVIGWIRFLQELVQEVATRAAGCNFTARSIAPATAPRPVTPLQPATLSAIPRMRAGSDADQACRQIEQNGMVTTAWATAQGIPAPVLRRIIVGFRRHGARLETVSSRDGNPAYVLTGEYTLPVDRARVFAAPAAPAATPVPEAPTPAPVAPQPVRTRAADFVAYPFEAGLSAETLAWVAERVETLAEASA